MGLPGVRTLTQSYSFGCVKVRRWTSMTEFCKTATQSNASYRQMLHCSWGNDSPPHQIAPWKPHFLNYSILRNGVALHLLHCLYLTLDINVVYLKREIKNKIRIIVFNYYSDGLKCVWVCVRAHARVCVYVSVYVGLGVCKQMLRQNERNSEAKMNTLGKISTSKVCSLLTKTDDIGIRSNLFHPGP